MQVAKPAHLLPDFAYTLTPPSPPPPPTSPPCHAGCWVMRSWMCWWLRWRLYCTGCIRSCAHAHAPTPCLDTLSRPHVLPPPPQHPSTGCWVMRSWMCWWLRWRRTRQQQRQLRGAGEQQQQQAAAGQQPAEGAVRGHSKLLELRGCGVYLALPAAVGVVMCQPCLC
jgi:hypothetical protein